MTHARAAAGLLRRVACCAAVALLVAPVTAAALSTGAWGGDGIRLQVDADHASVDTECGSGRIRGPIETDALGRFEADGSYDAHTGGPQRADVPAGVAPAHYSGVLDGDRLSLTIAPAGGPAQRFELKRGARVKLVRCL